MNRFSTVLLTSIGMVVAFALASCNSASESRSMSAGDSRVHALPGKLPKQAGASACDFDPVPNPTSFEGWQQAWSHNLEAVSLFAQKQQVLLGISPEAAKSDVDIVVEGDRRRINDPESFSHVYDVVSKMSADAIAEQRALVCGKIAKLDAEGDPEAKAYQDFMVNLYRQYPYFSLGTAYLVCVEGFPQSAPGDTGEDAVMNRKTMEILCPQNARGGAPGSFDGPADAAQQNLAGTVDVDGDGVPDTVGVSTGNGQAMVFVTTAGGNYGYRVANSPQLPDGRGVLVGAFQISRSAGADLVLHTAVGQGNADQFAVIGWRNGRLVAVPQPPQAGQPDSGSDTWHLMESHGQQNWVTCASGGAITMHHLKAPTAEGMPVPGGGMLESNHWQFIGLDWSPAGSESLPRSDFSYNFDSHTQAFQCEDQLQR